MKENNIKNRIVLDIGFEDLELAFEYSNPIHHFFIDIKENSIIDINEEFDTDVEEKLEKMENNRYIVIPKRASDEDFYITELFIYYLQEEKINFSIIEKFHDVLHKRKPFKNFRSLLDQYPEIKEKWFKYKNKEIMNEIMTWLYENNIELKNSPLPSIKIRELTREEVDKLPLEIIGFSPIECMNCGNGENLKIQYFLPNVRLENIPIEEEIARIMEEKYNLNEYGVFSYENAEILHCAKCLKCGSEKVFCDY